VILADFTLSADGTVATLDCFAHRRYVVSFADYFFVCKGRYYRYDAPQVLEPLRRPAALMDVSMADSSIAPSQAVAVKTADGTWTTMPIFFTVKPGETLSALLAAEGDRQYFDSTTGETYSLRELYALSGARPDAAFANVQDAIRPLEGLKMDVPGLRVVQGSMANLISGTGMESLQSAALGDPAAAPTLKAEGLQGVDAASKVGAAVAGQTIAEVAAIPQADFIRKVTAGMPAEQAAAAEVQARDVWTKASRVVALAGAWNRS
jgi:hypothetical protein